jgi:hypothetical protein
MLFFLEVEMLTVECHRGGDVVYNVANADHSGSSSPSLAQATGSGNLVHTSQLALPEATCQEVYATSGYSASVQNLANISLEQDNIFSDGYSTQMATVSGDITNGYIAQLTVGVDI